MLQFFRSSMEEYLIKEATKNLDKNDVGIFVDICNIEKQIKKLGYFDLKKKWKELKTKELKIGD